MSEAEFCYDIGQELADIDQYERERRYREDSLVHSCQKRIENQREEIRRLNKRINDLTQSRDTWKKQAERVGKQLNEVLSKKG